MEENPESPHEWFTSGERDKILRNVGTQSHRHPTNRTPDRLRVSCYVFRENPPTLAEIERNASPAYRSRTLGKLLEALRADAAIDADFDEKFLKPYLEMRNEFVHRLTIGEGKSFKTNSGKLNALNKAFGMASGQIMEAIGVPLRKWLESKDNIEVRAEVKTLIEQFNPDSPYPKAFAQAIEPRTEPKTDISARSPRN